MDIGISIRTRKLEDIDFYLRYFRNSPGTSDYFEINYISAFEAIPGRELFLNGLKERILQNNIKTSAHFISYNLSEPNRKFQEIIIEEFHGMLEYLSDMGTELIVVHPGYLDYYETPAEVDEYFMNRMNRDIQVAREFSVRMLRKFCDLAPDKVILIENLPLPRAIAKDYWELLELKAGVNRENLRLILDTGHLNVRHGDIYSNILGMGKELCHIHAHDNNSIYDQHLVPGEGNIDWQSFRRGLEEIGYQGVIMMELNDHSLAAVQKAFAFITKLFA